MRLHHPGEPLQLDDIPAPTPRAGEIAVKVLACGVCRTDLHIVDGELPSHRSPLVPGHQVVGRVVQLGDGVDDLRLGQRVGIPWLGHACGHCPYCIEDRENLCDTPEFTGYDRDGGYAEFATAYAAYCLPLPDGYGDVEIAPLLCAGLIGHRAYRRADGDAVGLIGFGASAHIVCQIAVADGRRVYAFTRPGDVASQALARELGCPWAHLDIAPRMTSASGDELAKGAAGEPVRLLFAFIESST